MGREFGLDGGFNNARFESESDEPEAYVYQTSIEGGGSLRDRGSARFPHRVSIELYANSAFAKRVMAWLEGQGIGPTPKDTRPIKTMTEGRPALPPPPLADDPRADSETGTIVDAILEDNG